MTADEALAAQSRLNELDTAAAELRRTIGEGIEAARAINQKVRSEQHRLRGIDEAASQVRQALKEHAKAEAVRLAAEAQAKVEA